MFFLLSLLLSKPSFADHPREQKQTMPIASIWQNSAKKNVELSVDTIRNLFLSDARGNKKQNKYIPEKTKDLFRIATFNVRMWSTVFDEPNFNNIDEVIQKIDADIIILQEVTDWQKVYEHYTGLGYNKKAPSCNTNNPPFSPVIFAKNCNVQNCFSSKFQHQGSPERELSFVRLDILLNNTPIALYGTHLETGGIIKRNSMESTRTQQIEEIFDDIKKLPHSNVIIAGDFNSIRPQDFTFYCNKIPVMSLIKEWYTTLFTDPFNPTTLEVFSQNNYKSSFDLLGWQSPKFTNWRGLTLDRIFLSSELKLKPIGSYVFYTDASDHLPIIVDLKL